MTGNYNEGDFEKMNDETLAAAGKLLFEGRQYDGIEWDKDMWAEVAIERLEG